MHHYSKLPVGKRMGFSPGVLYSYYMYRPFAGGVASRLTIAINVAMVTPILYDSSNYSNLKYKSYRPYGWFLKIVKLWLLNIEFYGEWQKVASHVLTVC